MKSLVALNAWCKLIGWIESAWNKLKSRLIGINNKSQWAELPDDVLELIMKRLSLQDYIKLRAVCSTWKATVDNAIANKHCHPLPELPIVLLESVGKSSFFSLSTKRELCPKTPLFESNQCCFGSIEGWIIVGEFVDVGSLAISFFNPVTNARVLLQSHMKFPKSNSSIPITTRLYLPKLVASSKPTCSDCIVVCLFSDFRHITFCKPSDNSWTIIKAKKGTGLSFMDVEIIDGKLYAITNHHLKSILVYDLQHSSYDDDPPMPKMLIMLPWLRPAPLSYIEGNQCYGWGQPIYHLAKDEASGELLLIQMRCYAAFEIQHLEHTNTVAEYIFPPQIDKVAVFKLERNRWVKVDSLGDRVVFVGGGKSIVMSRADFVCTEDSIAGNSIYFAYRYQCPQNPWAGFKIGMFFLTNNSFRYFTLDKNSCDTLYPFWFVPSIW